MLCPLKVRPSLPRKNITSIILSRRSWFFFAFLIHLVWFTNFCFELRLPTSIFCWKSTYAALASSCMLLLSWAWIFSICFFQFANCRKHSPRNVEQQARYKKYSVRWYWLAYPFSFRVSHICGYRIIWNKIDEKTYSKSYWRDTNRLHSSGKKQFLNHLPPTQIIPVENWYAVNRTGDKDVSRILAGNYFQETSIVGILQGPEYACDWKNIWKIITVNRKWSVWLSSV